jgi:hypothetical protein
VVIYEVNICIQKELSFDYARWLRLHIDDMLQLGCFLSAEIFVRHPKDEGESVDDPLHSHFTVHYRARDREAVELYLREFAPEMRRKVSAEFQDQVKIHRRILSRIRVDQMQSGDAQTRIENQELDRELLL